MENIEIPDVIKRQICSMGHDFWRLAVSLSPVIENAYEVCSNGEELSAEQNRLTSEALAEHEEQLMELIAAGIKVIRRQGWPLEIIVAGLETAKWKLSDRCKARKGMQSKKGKPVDHFVERMAK